MSIEHSAKNTRSMQLPREVVIGRDVLDSMPDVCTRLGVLPKGSLALVVADSNTLRIAGKRVVEGLESAHIECGHILVKRASMDEVDRVVELSKGALLLIGVGGGTVIDVSKLASTRLGIPFISVPTVASHDGIVSSRASIRDEGGSSVSVEAQAPMAVVADTGVIVRAPYRFLAAGCGDIISNQTAILDWKLAYRLKGEPYSEYASALSEMTAKIVMDSAESIKPNLEEAVRIVMKALVSSGVAMSIAGSSRPASGSEHKFSHMLDMIAPKPALHGEQCGVGSIMMMYLHGGNWRAIRDALMTIGAPTTAEQLKIPENCIVEALVRAREVRPERFTIIDGGLTEEAAIKLATHTGVIE
ncbi:MAG: NAD(P)-dependent glycerol-1-phosphate dehydrogenase [Methermicoccaceae archaeon]